MAPRVTAAVALLGATTLLLLLDGPEVGPSATLFAVTLLLLGLHHHRHWPVPARGAFVAFALGATGFFSIPIVNTVARNLRRLREWDYLGFWLHARSAVIDWNFYDPASARKLVAPFDVSPAFRKEIVDVGFWYPPPSMFLFWPLGWFDDPSAGLPYWIALQLAALAAAVVVAWRMFFVERGLVELIVCAALVVIGHGTYTTFYFSQTNFVALLALLLFWRGRESARGGAWLPVAVFVKPLLVTAAFLPLLGRRLRVVGGMALSAGLLTLASLWVFGPDLFVDYLTRDQVDSKPAWIYDEPTNQSLLGLVLRATDAECEGGDCVMNPIYLAGSALLGLITLALGAGLQRAREDEWALSLYLLLALITYPVSQLFYSVMLLPIVLLLWRRRQEVEGGPWMLSVLIATVFALAAVDWGATTALGFLLLWLTMAALGVRLVRGGGWPLRAAAVRLENGAG